MTWSTKQPLNQSHDLTIPSDRPLRLVIVSDTHSRPHPKSHELIDKQAPDAILHAGDVGALEVLDGLGAIARTIAVRGNVDERAPVLPDLVDVTVRRGSEPIARLLVKHFAVYGPKLRADAIREARAAGATMVVCGHSHVPFIGRDRGLVVLNPGSIGPRRFQLPITFGVLVVGTERLDLRHVCCETGETWYPTPNAAAR